MAKRGFTAKATMKKEKRAFEDRHASTQAYIDYMRPPLRATRPRPQENRQHRVCYTIAHSRIEVTVQTIRGTTMSFPLLISDLDERIASFAPRLRDDLKIEPPASLKLASAILAEVRTLPLETLPTLSSDSPLSLKDRYDTVTSYISWQQQAKSANTNGQIIALNYMCFVYLGENCFKVLRKELPTGSVGHKCCKALTDNPVRAFRNALAHGNWRISLDQSCIDFWAKKGADPNEQMSRWRFTENDLSFWQYLSIGTAVGAMAAL